MKKRNHPLYRDTLIEDLRSNPAEMEAYLEGALEAYEDDGDVGALLLALRTVAQAQGGMQSLAKKTKMPRQSLYKALSSRGNPRLNTIGSILNGLGYRLTLERIHG